MSADVCRRDILKLMVAAAAMPAAATGAREISRSAKKIRIRRLPWAGILIESENVALFIDAIAPDSKKGQPADVLATTREAHAIVSHNHGDHFSHDTVAGILGKNGLLVCQRAVADWIDQRGLRVQPVDLWQPVFFPRYGDDLVAFAVPAVDGWGVPQSSWVIDAGGIRIFHGGDTQWHGHFADFGRAYGPFDAAFLPINGARQQDGRFSDLGIPAVLTPEQAAAAAKLLRSKVIVPIHFGNPDPPSYVEVRDAVAALETAAKRMNVAVQTMDIGQSIEIPAGS